MTKQKRIQLHLQIGVRYVVICVRHCKPNENIKFLFYGVIPKKIPSISAYSVQEVS
jgi:hypothetical protein